MSDQTVEQALDLVPEAGPSLPPPRLQRFQWLGILRNAARLTRTILAPERKVLANSFADGKPLGRASVSINAPVTK